ncbi:MAG TPA: nuclear transport factor 2 family protein [Acidimicrobiales bacterium]|nr:nuclear transport factor 2 family protein [Acidimicrobiales bacterium]
MTEQVDPADLIGRYFSAVTARNVDALRALFSPTAVLTSGPIRLDGRDAIIAYYVDNTFTFDDFHPVPGPLRIEGGRVTVSIDVRLGGLDHTVRDVFETEDSLITSLDITGFEEALQSARPS